MTTITLLLHSSGRKSRTCVCRHLWKHQAGANILCCDQCSNGEGSVPIPRRSVAASLPEGGVEAGRYSPVVLLPKILEMISAIIIDPWLSRHKFASTLGTGLPNLTCCQEEPFLNLN